MSEYARNLDTYMDGGDDDVVGYCHTCDGECEWVECDVCGGEGGQSPHEVSPIEYGPDEWDECDQCEGQGGWQVCRACEGDAQEAAVAKAAAAMTADRLMDSSQLRKAGLI